VTTNILRRVSECSNVAEASTSEWWRRMSLNTRQS